jgi:hypothetical protein
LVPAVKRYELSITGKDRKSERMIAQPTIGAEERNL